MRYFNSSVVLGQFASLFNSQCQALCLENINSLPCVLTTAIVYPVTIQNTVYFSQPVSAPTLSPQVGASSSSDSSSDTSGLNLTYFFFALLGVVGLSCCSIACLAIYLYRQHQQKKASVDEFFGLQQQLEDHPISIELRNSSSAPQPTRSSPNPNTTSTTNKIEISDDDEAQLETVESSLRGSNLFRLFSMFSDPNEDPTPRVASLYSGKSSRKGSSQDDSGTGSNRHSLVRDSTDMSSRRKSSKLELSGNVSPYERYSAGSFRNSMDGGNLVAIQEDPIPDEELAITMDKVSSTMNPMDKKVEEEVVVNGGSSSSNNKDEDIDLARQRSSKRIASTVIKLTADIKNISL